MQYRMAQNFDEWASGKVSRKKFDEFHNANACTFING